MKSHFRLLLVLPLLVLLVVSCHRKKAAVESTPAAVEEQKATEKAKTDAMQKASTEVETATSTAEASASAFSLTIEGITVANAITDRQPQGEAESFSIGAGDAMVEVITWNRILGAKEDLTIKHVYYLNGEKMDEIPLKVGSANWRTWSRKQIKAEHAGNWKVEVQDPAGAVLASKTFVVSASPAAAASGTTTE